jgi:hypothetical protein
MAGGSEGRFIVGPIAVGRYWLHRRPGNRFGLMLIVLGLLGVPYILESSSDPTLFHIGVVTEDLLFLMITTVILATGTPPRRRALAIGVPIALLFLLVEATYRALFVFAPNGLAPSARPIQNVLQRADAGTRCRSFPGRPRGR